MLYGSETLPLKEQDAIRLDRNDSRNLYAGEPFADVVYFILKRTRLKNILHHINNLHQNIKFTMEEESNGELDTLLKRENEKISVLVETYAY